MAQFQGFMGRAIKFALRPAISQGTTATATATPVPLLSCPVAQVNNSVADRRLISPVDWCFSDCTGLAPPAAGH